VTPASGYISGGGGGFPTDHAAYRPGRGRALGQHARVGILDTDLYPHPRLAGRYIADAGSLLGRNGTEPYHAGHATFVAGLVVQEAPGTELHIDAVLNRQDAVATAWQVARAMVKFIGSDIDVLNLSMGCFTADGEPPMVLQRAVELLTPDVVLVAAAGNHGKIRGSGFITPKSPFWPAALPDVVAVGAHDANGHRAGFSPKLPWIDLSAPGVDVVSTYLNGTVITDKASSFAGYASWSGTSFAAATVTGAIAANIKPGRTARQSLQLLLDTPAPPATEPNEAPSARTRARIWQFQE
jgi:membrane-anchored mycosin MYCP